MNRLINWLGVIVGFLGAMFIFSKKSVVDASKETKKVNDKLEEIKEKTNETPIDDLVAKSNKRYGPGSGSGDS